MDFKEEHQRLKFSLKKRDYKDVFAHITQSNMRFDRLLGQFGDYKEGFAHRDGHGWDAFHEKSDVL
jgi:hypothetical protein